MFGATLAEKRFSELRRKLDELGYTQTLGFESVPLVEKLLKDLLQYRRVLQNHLETNDTPQLIRKQSDASAGKEHRDHTGLKSHTAASTKNDHFSSQNEAEALEKCRRDVQRLEHENQRLKFLTLQYENKIRVLERTSEQKSAKITELEEKGPKPVIEITADSAENGAVGNNRREKMEISCLLPKKELPSSQPSDTMRQRRDPFVLDLLHVAETKISRLQSTVEELNTKLKAATTASRSNLYSNTMVWPISASSLLYGENASSETMAGREEMLLQLSSKIEALKEHIRELEAKDDERSRGTMKGVRDSKRGKRQPLSSRKTATRAKEVVNDLDTNVVHKGERQPAKHRFESTEERETLLKDNKELVALLMHKDRELLRLEEHASRLKSENHKLGEQIRHLIAANSYSESSSPAAEDHGAMERLIQSLESQRDHYREEVKALREMLCSHHKESSEESRTRQSEKAGSSPVAMKLLEDEKNFYKQQYEEILRKQLRSDVTPPTHDTDNESESSAAHRKDENEDNESALKREAEKLRWKLNEAKNEIAEIKGDVDALMRLTYVRPLGASSENGRETAALAKDSDDNRPPLPMSSSLEDTRVKKLEGRIQSLQEIIAELKSENAELRGNLESHTTLIKALQSQNRALRTTQSEAVAASHPSASEEFTATSAHRPDKEELAAEESRDARGRGGGVAHSSDSRARRMDDGNDESRQQAIAKYQKELVSLKAAMAALDREKTQLQAASDDKDGQLLVMQRLVEARDHDLHEARLAIAALENELGKLRSEVRNKEREVKNASTRSAVKAKELESADRHRDSLREEVRQLEENLSVLAKDNQNLVKNLEMSTRERDQLRQQIQEYVTEVKRVEELLAIKEQERLRLIEEFRNMAQENSALDDEAHRLEFHNSNAQIEILAKESELKYCRSLVSSLELRIQELETMQHNYEQQVAHLNSVTATLQESSEQSRKEAERLASELAASRDACFRLELAQSNLRHQLASAEAEREKAVSQLEELQEEVATLRAGLASEKATALSLEGLLARSRDREFRTQVSLQEMSAELKVLKERLRESEEKIRAYGSDIATYKTRIGELQMQVDRLKRQLTDERFERERANQELRKLRQRGGGETTISITPRRLASSSSSPSPTVSHFPTTSVSQSYSLDSAHVSPTAREMRTSVTQDYGEGPPTMTSALFWDARANGISDIQPARDRDSPTGKSPARSSGDMTTSGGSDEEERSSRYGHRSSSTSVGDKTSDEFDAPKDVEDDD